MYSKNRKCVEHAGRIAPNLFPPTHLHGFAALCSMWEVACGTVSTARHRAFTCSRVSITDRGVGGGGSYHSCVPRSCACWGLGDAGRWKSRWSRATAAACRRSSAGGTSAISARTTISASRCARPDTTPWPGNVSRPPLAADHRPLPHSWRGPAVPSRP
jgi:hypothetical protein